MEKLNRGMEHFWLAVVIASLIYAIWQCVSLGWSVGYYNFLIPGLAGIWFLFRRTMRKRIEKNMKKQ